MKTDWKRIDRIFVEKMKKLGYSNPKRGRVIYHGKTSARDRRAIEKHIKGYMTAWKSRQEC